MARCPAITRAGRPCKGLVGAGCDYCPAHDPARSEARQRAASKAARSKPNKELAALKDQLAKLAEDTLAGRVDRGVAAVVGQIANVRLRLIETERRLKETEELEERLRELEEMAL